MKKKTDISHLPYDRRSNPKQRSSVFVRVTRSSKGSARNILTNFTKSG